MTSMTEPPLADGRERRPRTDAIDRLDPLG
ncbi:MAG: hypothetical protein JWR37_4295 [Mycobacterium sp.]|nr:hypothetical protein [Mycobacterium sp.]